MLVTINDLSDPPRQVELELPLYRTIDTSNDRFEVVYYYKVDDKGGQLRRLEICIDGLNGLIISIVDNFSFTGVTSDFILGEGSYRVSNEQEFEEALGRVKRKVAEFEL